MNIYLNVIFSKHKNLITPRESGKYATMWLTLSTHTSFLQEQPLLLSVQMQCCLVKQKIRKTIQWRTNLNQRRQHLQQLLLWVNSHNVTNTVYTPRVLIICILTIWLEKWILPYVDILISNGNRINIIHYLINTMHFTGKM